MQTDINLSLSKIMDTTHYVRQVTKRVSTWAIKKSTTTVGEVDSVERTSPTDNKAQSLVTKGRSNTISRRVSTNDLSYGGSRGLITQIFRQATTKESKKKMDNKKAKIKMA